MNVPPAKSVGDVASLLADNTSLPLSAAAAFFFAFFFFTFFF